VGIPASFQSNWDPRSLVQKSHGSNYDRFQNTLEHQREHLLHLEALATCFRAQTKALKPSVNTRDKPGSASDKSGSASDKSGSTSNHSGAVWEKSHLLWDHFWCAWKLLLLLIIQRLLYLIYLVCILIYFSILLSNTPIPHMVHLDWMKEVLVSNSWCAWKWQSGGLREVLPGHDCGSLERHLEPITMCIYTYTRTVWCSQLRDAPCDHNCTSLEMHLGAMIVRTWKL
jgi:hypothetical protein